jgi:bifunctional DNA-binding transcriptional regulator/antitoxin component of YhaV-PrlF toxin-antitoxin module
MKGPMSFIVTADTRGRVTIPIQLRRKLGWMKRMRVLIREVNGVLWIEPARNVKRPGGDRRR